MTKKMGIFPEESSDSSEVAEWINVSDSDGGASNNHDHAQVFTHDNQSEHTAHLHRVVANGFGNNHGITNNGSVDMDMSSLPIDMQFNSGHVIAISVYSVLFVLSAAGNITLLLAILRRKRPLQSLSRIDYLLVHLAIADLIVTFFMMPLEIGWAATVYWTAGDLMCRLMSFFRIFGLYLSGFVLVCLAVDRYLAVAYPMQGLASSKRAKIMVTFAWLLSSFCSLPQVAVFHVLSHPRFSWYTQCVTFNSFGKSEHELLYQVFGMIMMYALPLLLIVILYGSIALKLCKMSGNSTSNHVRNTNTTTTTTTTTTVAFHTATPGYPAGLVLRRTGRGNIERAKINSIKMTFVITAVFLVCWTPYYVMCVWYWIDPEAARNVDQRVQKGLFLFASTNSTVNPIVYGVFHKTSIFGRGHRSRTFSVRESTTSTRATATRSVTTTSHL